MMSAIEDNFTLSENPGFSDVGDLQAVLDEEPCYPRRSRGPKPKYKPGTRQEPAARERAAAGEGSWWTRQDADYTKEAERMRVQHARLKVPGEHNIIGWKAAVGLGESW